MNSTDALIPSSFLFRLAVPCYRFAGNWTDDGVVLDERYAVHSFHAMLNQGPEFAGLRMGWNAAGIVLNVDVSGKTQTPWCRVSRPTDSDGLSLLLDTRNMQSIHRAGRFCHRLVFLPLGDGRMADEPHACLVEIHRARENPRPIPPGKLRIASQKRDDGYSLQAFIPAGTLTGFEPAENTRLGFSYALADRELGWQTFNLGPEFPFLSDPSLWGTMELTVDP